MIELMPYLWIIVSILAAIIEALTTALVSMWFIPAGIIAAVMALLDVDVKWQIVVFLVISIACIALQKTVLKKFMKKADTRTNIDTIIGEKGIVTEKIDNLVGLGQVKVKGLYWAARSVDGVNYDVGDVLTVVAIEGVKLICKK
ncbi:MAG: NfeD family protein [Eubacteriales bacterium]|nr:NfeD family protein [Eubacteriales bacterium]